MRATALILLSVAVLQAASPSWLDAVAPLITPAEKKTYQSLPVADRADFERDFFVARAIAAEEYYRRLAHVDATWGSDKSGSGANTDPGRVYLSLGAPTRIARLPSSRTFVPLEVWYYDEVPGILNTELHLIFYRPGTLGLPKLYSPVTDTIRALLVPQAGTVHMFGPNDSLTESDIRRTLKTGPVEDEVITAAVGVAAGIKYSGNDEILGQIRSPRRMLSTQLRSHVTARLITAHPRLDFITTASPYGGMQLDLHLAASARRDIEIEVQDESAYLYRNRLDLHFPAARPVEYAHRLDLLPGQYRVIFTIDGASFGYPLEIPSGATAGPILRADLDTEPDRTRAPFSFEGRRIRVNPDGPWAVLPVSQPGKVTWIVRKGSSVVWRKASEAADIAAVELPATLPAGIYRLEAVTPADSRSVDITLGSAKDIPTALISFNANLAPAQRLRFIGHQYLLRGRLTDARRTLESSLREAATPDAHIDLARLDALAGNLDAARDRIQRVLHAAPDNFEALAVFASIEARLQDYSVAADLYRRALAVQESPDLRGALAQLPLR